MAHITADRVRETSTTTGTGNITVTGPLTSFRSFGSVLATNDTFYYAIASYSLNEWEIGIGTYASANTIARTTVIASSNANTAVNFSAGEKDVFITAPATRFLQADTSNNYGNFSAGTITAALTGNASTASAWQTARTLTIGSTGKSVNGSADVSWSLAEIGAAAVAQTMYIGTTAVAINRASAALVLTGITSIDGSAATLTTARTINGVSFNGSANITVPSLYDTNYRRITNPGGAEYVTNTATVTGAIAINFPVGMTGSMTRVTIKIYEYTTNESFEVHAGGYNYATGNTWANSPYAYIVGNPSIDRRFTVRFGYTAGGKAVIYIGELNSSWAYPQVYVTDVQIGYNGNSVTYTSGWTIDFQSSAFENVTATITNAQVGYAVSTNTTNAAVLRDASGNFSAGTITAALSGNASTASTWQTARTLTIGSTGKSVNGSADVSWSLAELGAAATNQTMYIGTTAVAINRASAALTLAGISLTAPDIGAATGTSLKVPKIYINRAGTAASGISWYNEATYSSWAEYMAQAGQTSVGPTANITAPSGTIVTSWALRSLVENSAGYGWTFEAASGPTGAPSVVAEIRSSDGAARFGGGITNSGFLGTGASNAKNHLTQTNSGAAAAANGWISAVFGDTNATRTVIGQAHGYAYLGAHDVNLTAWAGLHLQNDATAAVVTIGYPWNTAHDTTYRLRVNGNTNINGTLYATSKSFLIDHPTKPGMKLRYGSLEGPENGVYVRGKLEGNVIELPEYWTKLVDPDSITVQLTPIGKHQKLYVEEIRDNKIFVGNDGLFAGPIKCFYYVLAERNDIEKMKVEI